MVRCSAPPRPMSIFNVQRHLTSLAGTHRDFRVSAPQTCCQVVIAARSPTLLQQIFHVSESCKTVTAPSRVLTLPRCNEIMHLS